MEILIAAVLAASLLVASILLLGRLAGAARDRRERLERGAAREGPSPRACPLCSSTLGPGERVKSKLFPGKGDRIMHIFGCGYCWPATPSAPRICPVCGEELTRDGWVVARYFERPARPGQAERRHVHVLGCTSCRGS
jgi:hypothetical protein